MAKFLDTRKCAAELSDLIKDTGLDLILISPYLQLSKDFRDLLAYRDGKGKNTTLIFREPKLTPDDTHYFRALRRVTLRYHVDLHAKCYANDKKMIITSMNLYEFSMDHNNEMGVLVDKADPADARLFQDAFNEAQYIIETSRLYEYQPAANAIPPPIKGKMSKTAKKNIGYCIRTGVEIPFNVDKPLSAEAYKKWNEFGNPNYPEKYCHFSGDLSNGETSVNKPILKKHWKKAQETHGF
jgi:phosphatidylserine/phosphatidylglycerophosphate/cardiolipin synthase-like enzyme